MSASGQKQTSDYRLLMSALPPKADIRPKRSSPSAHNRRKAAQLCSGSGYCHDGADDFSRDAYRRRSERTGLGWAHSAVDFRLAICGV
jgi:hypothetical protein